MSTGIKRDLKRRRRLKRKRLAELKRHRREQVPRPTAPVCLECGEPKTWRPKKAFTAFTGIWACEPCQARHLADFLERRQEASSGA